MTPKIKNPLHLKRSKKKNFFEDFSPLFQALFFEVSEGILITDRQGKILQANLSALDLVNLPLSQLIGRQLSDFTGEVVFKDLKKKQNSFSKDRLINDLPFSLHISGETIIAESLLEIRLFPGYFFISIRSEKGKSGQKLVSSFIEKLNNTVFPAKAKLLFSVTDKKGTFIYVNQEFCETFKYDCAELLGNTHSFITSGFHSKEFINNLSSTLKCGKVWKNKINSSAKDGSIKWVDAVVFPLLETDNKLNKYFIVCHETPHGKNSSKTSNDNETRLSNLADAAPALIWTTDNNKSFNYFNKRWLEFTGRTFKQEAGNGWMKGIHPDDLLCWQQKFTDNFNNRKEFAAEYRLKQAGGKYRWILNNAAPQFSDDGDFTGFIGISTDINQIKSAQEPTAEPDEKFQIIVNKPESKLIWYTDENGRHNTPSNWWTDLTGLEVDGTDNWLNALHPDDQEITTKIWHNALKNKTHFNIEYRLKIRNGDYRHFAVCGIPIFNEDGKFRQWTGTFDEISDRKKLEEKAEFSERRLQYLISNLASFAGLTNSRGILLEVNHAAFTSPNVKIEEILGKSLEDTYWWSWSKDVQRQMRQAISRASQGETLRFDVITRIAEQKFITIDFQIAPIFSAEGKVTHLIQSAIDITERLHLEASLAHASQMTIAGELAACLAHEIKNPLAGIQGAIDILIQRQNPDKDDYDILQNIRHEIVRIDETVGVVLNRAQVRVMHFKIDSLTETLRNTLKTAAYLIAARKNHNRIKFEANLSEESDLFLHDAAQIEDALLNLIINAIDSIGDNKGTIKISFYKKKEIDIEEFIIEVSDTGCGISKDSIAKIFTPFYTTKKAGTGLGLPAVKRIVNGHGGYYQVKSAVGKGTTFTIHLPINSGY